MSVLTLKLAAVAAMLADHIGHLYPALSFAPSLRIAGRLALPVFAFLIAEGYRHTRDVRRYALRLLTLAVLSEIPFDLLRTVNAPSPLWIDYTRQNVFFTLLLGLLAVWAIDRNTKLHRPALGWMAAAALAVLADQMQADFGAFGVAVIVIFFVFRGDRLATAAAFCLALAVRFVLSSGMLGLSGSALSTPALMSLAAALALPLIFAHNGKKGYRGAAMQWGFYLFYPLHMAALVALKMALG